MMVGDIVPIHQQGVIARIQIGADQAAGIGLLVHQRDARRDAQQFAVGGMAKPQIGRDHAGRHQWPDHLGIAGADEFHPARLDQRRQPFQPGSIALGDGVKGIAGCLDPDGAVTLGQVQQRAIAILHHIGALFLFDGGKGQIQVEEGKDVQQGGLCRYRDHRAR